MFIALSGGVRGGSALFKSTKQYRKQNKQIKTTRNDIKIFLFCRFTETRQAVTVAVVQRAACGVEAPHAAFHFARQ